MKPNRLLSALVAVLICSMAALAQSASPAPDSVNSGWAKVITLKGEVQVKLPAQTFIPASREMILPAGSSIQTKKGSALLQLSDGSEVLVKSNSAVLLKSPERSEHQYLELLLGKIRAAIKKRLQGAPSFRLGTPTAVITVRGTQFEVKVNKKLATNVVVYEGLVEVTGVGYQGPPVLLGPGYMIDVPRTGIPSRPHRTIENDHRLEQSAGREDNSLTPQSRQHTGEEGQRTYTPTQSGSGQNSGEGDSPDH
jgi:hypothetical protein